MNQAEPRTPRNHAQHELDGFKSQIPIRTPRRTRRASPKNAGSNNGPSPRTPGRREQHRDAPQQLRINVQPAAPAPPAPASLSPSVSVLLQSVEKVFSVYEDRSRMARHDVQKVLTDLLVKEQQQKEKWYFLFVKMMKERDVFRQRVEVLESAVAAASRAVKREREEEEEGKMGFAAAAAAGEKAGTKSRSASPRPIRPLRAVSPTSSSLSGKHTLFPVHSPFSTPPCSTPPPANSASSYGTAPPLSACSTSSSSSESASSSSSSGRRDSISHTSSMHEYSDSDPEDLPKVKRRKSCDDGTSSISSNHSRGGGLPGHDKFLIYRTLDATALPSTQSYSRPVLSARTGTAATVAPSTEFSHVDIMYTRIDNRLVCRACLLEASKSKRISPPPPQSGSSPSDSEENKNKNSNSSPSSKATSFPPTASWDSLRDHCVKMHPRECEDVGRLHPAELFELRKRLNLPA